MNVLSSLEELRRFGGTRLTDGLTDDVIARFAELDPDLPRAVEAAVARHRALREHHTDLLALDEAELRSRVQDGLVNFYSEPTINPYVALAAAGPWLVTTHGAVLHDNGGYGMLGFGHDPVAVREAMAGSWVMANVMTPSMSHRRFLDAIRAEIGHARDDAPYAGFIALNSGSESVTLALRVCDVHARHQTDPGGRHAGRPVKILSMQGSFHGRTDRPAQISDSTIGKYRENLATFRDRDNLITVPPNDLEVLRSAFERAEDQGVFIEAVFLEPVMGEGDPGRAIERPFYDLARELTRDHGALLVVDSVQAGLRTQGTLSIVDYPDFTDAEPPDMETYSKALNAGQYPLSILAMSELAAGLYVRGLYGNTMTTNPRALEVASTVLEQVTPELRANIRERGAEAVERMSVLMDEFPGVVTKVQGTGLLFSVAVEGLPVVGFGGLEEWCRIHGVGVIHGGANALRYTPHFRVTSAELELLVDNLRAALQAATS